MKDRPILFNGAMVRALLDDSKTKTRRIIARPLQNPGWTEYRYFGPSKNNPTCQSKAIECGPDYPDGQEDQVLCPYGQAGDRLWVRETFYAFGRWEKRFSVKKSRDEWHFVDMTLTSGFHHLFEEPAGYVKRSKGRRGALPMWHKRPSIFIPRVASRITLEIVSVRVERLNDISEADVIAEGCPSEILYGTGWYRELWETINGAGSWDENPWVWVVEFKRVINGAAQ